MFVKENPDRKKKKIGTLIPSHDLFFTYLSRTQFPNIKTVFKYDSYYWTQPGVSAVGDRGLINTLQAR